MDKNDKKIIDEALKESTPVKPGEEGNLSSEHSLTVQQTQALSQNGPGIPIEGFNDLPMSMVALPYCVIVQGLTDVYMADGKTPAPKGKWYFNDVKEVSEEINFVCLRAMVREKDVEDPDTGELRKRTKLYCLCVNVENPDEWEPFILVLPVTSFTTWGQMIAQMKKQGTKSAFEWIVKGTLRQDTNKRGQKYYVGDFVLREKLNAEDLEKMREKFGVYGGVLDRRDIEESEEV